MTGDLATLVEKTRPIFKKYGFRKVGVFGSRARGDNRNDSDADFLFSDEGNPITFLEKQEAEEELKNILGVEVDLVPDTKVVARMRPYIKRDLKIIVDESVKNEIDAPWKMIIGLRNIISHEYFLLELETMRRMG